MYSIKMSKNPDYSLAHGVLQYVTVLPGSTYRLSFWSQSPSPASSGSYQVYDYGTPRTIVALTHLAPSSTAWFYTSVDFTVPAGTTQVAVILFGYLGSTPNVSVYYDDVSLRYVTQPTRTPLPATPVATRTPIT